MVAMVNMQAELKVLVDNTSKKKECNPEDSFKTLFLNFCQSGSDVPSSDPLQEMTDVKVKLNLMEENLETGDVLHNDLEQDEKKELTNQLISCFMSVQNVSPPELKNSELPLKNDSELGTGSIERNARVIITNLKKENPLEMIENQDESINADFKAEIAVKQVLYPEKSQVGKETFDPDLIKKSISNNEQLQTDLNVKVNLKHRQTKPIAPFRETLQNLTTTYDGKNETSQFKKDNEINSVMTSKLQSQIAKQDEISIEEGRNQTIFKDHQSIIRSFEERPKPEFRKATFINGMDDQVKKQTVTVNGGVITSEVQKSTNDEMSDRIFIGGAFGSETSQETLAKKQDGIEKSDIVSFESALQLNLKNQSVLEMTGKERLPKDVFADVKLPVHAQITSKISDSLKDNILNFKMKLNPEGLGQLSVHVSYQNGKVSLELLSNVTSTKQLLMGQIDDLKSALIENHVQVSNIFISSEKVEHMADLNHFGSFGSGFSNAKEQSYTSEKRYPKELLSENDFEMDMPSMSFKSGVFNYRI